MDALTLTEAEFGELRRLLHRTAGIALADSKKPLVLGRLANRLRAIGHGSFTAYLRQIAAGDGAELRTMVDLLTTNETSFFREAKHFDVLRGHALERGRTRAPFAVWSAACSSGEEPYTIAMVLMDALGPDAAWEVVATDISGRVLERARQGLYAMDRARGIPPAFLRRYCLKGVREQAGNFLIAPELRQRVRFEHLNLTQPLPDRLGPFDTIFLRNVMIYFDLDTKRQVVAAMQPRLRPGGYFLIGHSETLSGIAGRLVGERPSVYRLP